MDTRGWDHPRVIHAETTACEPIDILTGITPDPHAAGRKVGALAVGDGPPVLLRLAGDVSNGTALIEAIRRTLADLMDIEKLGGAQ